MDVFGQSGSNRERVVVFGQRCIRVKVVVFWQKWLYSGKSGCIRAKLLYSGKSCCIRANNVVIGKFVVFGKVVVFGQGGCNRAKNVVIG